MHQTWGRVIFLTCPMHASYAEDVRMHARCKCIELQ